MGTLTQRDIEITTAAALLEAVSERLAETEAGAPPWVYLVPGSDVAWDYCNCDGQLTIHQATAYPSRSFPAQDVSTDSCLASYTVVHFVVTILRCVPTQDDDGHPPAPEEGTPAALGDWPAARAVRKGVLCYFEALAAVDRRRPAPLVVIQEQLGVGADGQCGGSELHILVGFPNCASCDEVVP